MKIKDIKLTKYNDLSNRKSYDYFIDKVEPRPELNGQQASFKDVTLDEMEVLKKVIGKDEHIQLILDIFFVDVKLNDLYLYDFLSFYKWLVDALQKFHEKEVSFVGDADSKLLSAGIERLNQFGVWNTKIALAEQFGKFPSEIGKMRYLEVLQIVGYNSIRTDIQNNLNKQ